MCVLVCLGGWLGKKHHPQELTVGPAGQQDKIIVFTKAKATSTPALSGTSPPPPRATYTSCHSREMQVPCQHLLILEQFQVDKVNKVLAVYHFISVPPVPEFQFHGCLTYGSGKAHTTGNQEQLVVKLVLEEWHYWISAQFSGWTPIRFDGPDFSCLNFTFPFHPDSKSVKPDSLSQQFLKEG